MRWPKLKAFFSTGARAPETCEACGKAFVCGATLAGCWCAEVKLTEEQREELKKKYSRAPRQEQGHLMKVFQALSEAVKGEWLEEKKEEPKPDTSVAAIAKVTTPAEPAAEAPAPEPAPEPVAADGKKRDKKRKNR